MSKNINAAGQFPTLDDVEVAGKRVIVRMDLNVPMVAGRVTDNTRVVRLLPTIRELLKKKAKVIILSHLGRPEGKYVTDLSLAPLVDALAEVLKGVPIHFGVDCIGEEATQAVNALKAGEILLLENLRFHAGEEKNDAKFAKALAAHGDIFINDAFSCSHRSHASIVSITKYLPFAAGRLMEEELKNLKAMFTAPERPFTAVIGGAKVSTKLALLENLVRKVDNLIIGGAMANTFLLASGKSKQVGLSLVEPNLVDTARHILETAKKENCEILLPKDVFYTLPAPPGAPPSYSGIHAAGSAPVTDIPHNAKAVDFNFETLKYFIECLGNTKTVLWNGPMGLFETKTLDAFTTMIAREIARLTRDGKLKSIAGGGDTLAVLAQTGLSENFTYVSTAGGAFLEWMEGKTLPGVAVLMQ